MYPIRDRDQLLAGIRKKDPASRSASIAALIAVVETQDQVSSGSNHGGGMLRVGRRLPNQERTAIQNRSQKKTEPFVFQVASHQRVGLELIAGLQRLGEALEQSSFFWESFGNVFLQEVLRDAFEHLEVDDQQNVATTKEQALAADRAAFDEGCHGLTWQLGAGPG